MNDHVKALNPMDALPSLPSSVDKGTAGIWSGLVLMQAAEERGWDHADLRKLLIVLLAQFTIDKTSDDQLHAELQDVVDGMRARRAVKS